MKHLQSSIALLKEQWLKFAASLALALVAFSLLGVLFVVVSNGLAFFWPKAIQTINYQQANGTSATVFGYVSGERASGSAPGRVWLHLDSYGRARNQTQVVVNKEQVLSQQLEPGVARIDLHDGRFILSRPQYLKAAGEQVQLTELQQLRSATEVLVQQKVALVEGELLRINKDIARLKSQGSSEQSSAMISLLQRYASVREDIAALDKALANYEILLLSAAGEQQEIQLQHIRQVFYPNDMTLWQKLTVFVDNLFLFLSEDTRDANQSGGVFPAIFGTVLMVLLMAVFVSPLGIMAAIYLTEYAPNNTVVSIIRLAVSNLAAVPSVVYGVFGLGFFVYQIGGSLDELFYADALPNPTFGTPGLLWASLTMALLTLPVVIVATEEGLRRVPESLRHSSYALGATRYETIRRIVLPVASSSLMTGIILAVARAAGEVAPMLMVGAVRYAPVLPVDDQWPFLHLDRQFMHLGVLIYDGAFQGQATPQGAGMMFASCLLLLTVVLILNFIAIMVRNRLQNKYGH